MERRSLLACAALAPVAASAGVMDWYNGVKVGARLPAYDTQYLGAPPAEGAKLLLIDFWATWCAPCREEFPHLNALSAALSSQGLAVVGLTQEPVETAREFLRKVDIQYPVAAAGARPLQKQLGIKALPYAIVVDRSQTIVWRGQASTLSAAQVAGRLRQLA
jgi:thiol-disulfide isomerase/thioredoxin